MNLTPLQLEIQQQADDTLSFWCIVKPLHKVSKAPVIYLWSNNKWTYYWKTITTNDKFARIEFEDYDIVWHPMNWGRLCYLLSKLDTVEQSEKRFASKKALWEVERRLGNNKEYYQKTVLERPEKLQLLVLAFFKTLWT